LIDTRGSVGSRGRNALFFRRGIGYVIGDYGRLEVRAYPARLAI
jgi:hypothetical protein